jgi:hypothetical protein
MKQPSDWTSSDPLTTHQDKTRDYLQSLLELMLRADGLSPAEQDEVWISEYEGLMKGSVTVADLPKLLAMIHPEFLCRRGVAFRDHPDIRLRPTSSFKTGISIADRCQSVSYSGEDCVFNKYPSIRGVCQADHRWPCALGGPYIVDNRLILCRFHNVMKSSDISTYSWDIMPNWILDQLNRIYCHKR